MVFFGKTEISAILLTIFLSLCFNGACEGSGVAMPGPVDCMFPVESKMVSKADISLVRSLSDKKSREQCGMFVVEGRKMVAEALASSLNVGRVFGTEEFADMDGCETVSQKEVERMSSLRAPQGILALVDMPRYDFPSAPGLNELMLALDGVQDPGNLGTIMRLADWFGIRDIICSRDTVDCFGPKVVQASMGAIFRVRVHYCDLANVLRGIRAPVFGTFLEGENIYNTELDGRRGVIVLGNEGKGISGAVASTVTRKLFIPPYPEGSHGSESLNVGVAAAIVCSEFRRRSHS